MYVCSSVCLPYMLTVSSQASNVEIEILSKVTPSGTRKEAQRSELKGSEIQNRKRKEEGKQLVFRVPVHEDLREMAVRTSANKRGAE